MEPHMPVPRIPIPRQELAALRRRWKIRRLSLLGSILRDSFGPNSDIDVLVDFEPGATPTLFSFEDLRAELSSLFEGREIDLATTSALHPVLRDGIPPEAVDQHAA